MPRPALLHTILEAGAAAGQNSARWSEDASRACTQCSDLSDVTGRCKYLLMGELGRVKRMSEPGDETQ